MAVLLILEVLFFVLNKFGRDPVDQIKKIVADFFTVADVREAKELLRAELVRILCPDLSDRTWSELCKHVVADLPRLMTHNRGDNRGLLETADMLDLILKADEMNVLDKLPTFVAASYDKVPIVKSEDLDISLAEDYKAPCPKTGNFQRTAFSGSTLTKALCPILMIVSFCLIPKIS